MATAVENEAQQLMLVTLSSWAPIVLSAVLDEVRVAGGVNVWMWRTRASATATGAAVRNRVLVAEAGASTGPDSQWCLRPMCVVWRCSSGCQ